MAEVVNCQPVSAEARVCPWLSVCGVCGGLSGTGTGFSLSSSVSPCQYHTTMALHTHISPRGWTVGPLVPFQERSLTPSVWTTFFLTLTFLSLPGQGFSIFSWPGATCTLIYQLEDSLWKTLQLTKHGHMYTRESATQCSIPEDSHLQVYILLIKFNSQSLVRYLALLLHELSCYICCDSHTYLQVFIIFLIVDLTFFIELYSCSQ
jgi:hypothetical protein